MSKLKIFGKVNPVVGKKEYYSIHDFFGSSNPPSLDPSQFENFSDEHVKWSIWTLSGSSWSKRSENNKTGITVPYTFSQKSLNRKGIRMLVEANGEKAVLDIKTEKATQGKILHVDLLDNNYNKPTRPFAYGDWIIARVHCVDMELLPVKVTLWEDDGDKTKQNTTNIRIDTKGCDILNGIAYAKFYLNPSHAWLANVKLAKGDKNEGEFHEYYVTAEIFEKISKRVASKNANIPNPDYKPEVQAPKKQTPAEKKGPSKKEEKGISKSDKNVHDYHETKVSVKNEISTNPVWEKINSMMTVNIGGVWEIKKEKNCGEKYCIKKGDKSELIREINIRLAGFGGNVPTDEFTDRTEKMIKQFQRDYMQVSETGKVCGNVLKAIDEFQKKYLIHFDDIKCKCGKCKGFGNEKFKEQKQNSKIAEAYRKYEYPGIHRSLVWALRSVMFYCSSKEKELGYSVKCVASGYRCDEDNKQHNRNTTNHMGKALDIHFNKNGKRTLKSSGIILEMEEIRLKIFNKYLGAKWDWKLGQQNIFNLESTASGAKTWVHYDVREYDLIYLKDEYFSNTINNLDGESIVQLAIKTHAKTCSCMGSGTSTSQFPVISQKFQSNNFTVDNGKEALKIIYDKYGKDTASIIERMYRDETAHFTSGQYKACGTGGMESFGNAPYYGWDESFFESHQEYKPLGLWNAFENKGMSGLGGNKQVTDKKKSFVILPSVLAGMEYKAFYIKKYNGNWARWTSTDSSVQETYKKYINTITPKFVNEFESKN